MSDWSARRDPRHRIARLRAMPLARLGYIARLGPKRALWRLGWTLTTPLRGQWSPPRPPDLERGALDWRASLPWLERATGMRRAQELRVWAKQQLAPAAKRQLTKQAQDAAHARPWCFGQPGYTLDWRLDPITKRRWPADVPGHRALAQAWPGADVKLVWEPARFGHLQPMWRAATLGLLPEAAAITCGQLDDFMSENPAGLGVHWSSAQEVAIRAMNVLWATALLARQLDELDEDIFHAHHDALYLHAAFIYDHLDYARYAVPNNHLIVEASALLLLCRAFSGWPKAWASKAQAALHEGIDEQFDARGGYIQRSHNYQRLATEALMWLWVALEPAEALTVKIERACARSFDASVAALGLSHGRLPRWGAIDGAHLMQWSGCPFEDQRPWLQALGWVGHRRLRFEAGPWDESLMWLAGASAFHRPRVALTLEPGISAVGAQHILRVSADELAIMTTNAHGPFGQDDLGHVEIIHKGQPVAIDAGSYRYNGEPEAHAWAHGALAHNVLTHSGLGKRSPAGQFSWGSSVKAQSRCSDGGGAHEVCLRCEPAFIASSRGRHERILRRATSGWLVRDELVGVEAQVWLHWLLAPLDWTLVRERDAWALSASLGGEQRVTLRLWCPWATASPRLKPQRTSGQYNQAEPALGLLWRLPAASSLIVDSEFIFEARAGA